MDFIDDEAGSSQGDEILVPSSQCRPSTNRVRTNKRRRLNQYRDCSAQDSGSATEEYDLPSNDLQSEDDVDSPKNRYQAVIHAPAFAESQHNQFVTQVDQPWSSPTAIRGPRWRKQDISSPSKASSPSKESFNPPAPVTSQMQVSPDPVVFDNEFDDDDPEIIEALMAGENDRAAVQAHIQPKRFVNLPSMRQTTLFGMQTTQQTAKLSTPTRNHNWPMTTRDEPPTHHNINEAAMQTWIYPLNVGTLRDYQFNIVHKALFNNILVALPTGLGKTFIAATVMLNFFNWTRDSQIVFVAPTKPLVSQQVNACFHIAGIPRSQTTLLTGEIQPAVRAEEWQEKRVFFMTPQTLINDLKTGMADPKKIVLLVVDEAHKATGNYAYVEVVRFLRRFNSSFRVLALTATPGATVEAVQKVIDGLDIARVEIRTEESMDIRNFVHTRTETLELFDNSEEIEMCLDLFAAAVRPVLSKVNGLNAYFSNDPKTMTLYGLMKGREQWTKSDAGRKADWGLKRMVQSCFKPLMSLAHSLELLKFHGIGPFFHKMKIFDDEAYGAGKYTKQIVESESYKTLMNRLRTWVQDAHFVGHPKLTYLNEVVLNHFMDAGDGLGTAGSRPPSDTRIMVFAHYRDSAEEIVKVLNRHQPMIRAHVFVGQSGTKGSEGMDQKTQIGIIKDFKSGIYNTLVATSIGEEGLDIGEVDLIVCYDCSKSPIRMLQRMGRTGRKRAGNIVLLLMRGKEERDYHAAKDNYVKMQSIIEGGKDFQFHDDVSPRIVPRQIHPTVNKCHVDIPIENTQAGSPEPRKRKAKNVKRPPKKFHMPSGVETSFQFLGKNGRDKTVAASKSRLRLTFDSHEASLVPLNTVLLSAREVEDLEHRYAQVAGDEAQYVQPIRLDTFPHAILKPGPTSLVQHSTITNHLVRAFETMHDSNRQWIRPMKPFIFTDLLPNSDGTDVTLPANNCQNRRAIENSASTVRGRDARRNMKKGVSVDDRPSRHLPLSPPLGRASRATSTDDNRVSKGSILDLPFYVSQHSARECSAEVDELPNMSELFKNSAGTARQTTIRQAANNERTASCGRSGRPRRIVSEDSDD